MGNLWKIQQLPRDIRRKWKGSIAVDGTPIPAYARGVANKSPKASTDPTAGWYVREGDHAAPGADPSTGLPTTANGNKRNPAARKKSKSKVFFAHEATLAVMGPDSPDDELTFPLLVAGIVLHRPGQAPADHAIRALASIRDRGHPAGWIAGDIAYMPNSKPENFQLPARELGYEPIMDYPSDKLGAQDSYAGAILVDGSWYCPSMPTDLINATLDVRAKTIDEETWLARIDARNSYLVRIDGIGSESGAVAMRCPSALPSPTARCDLKDWAKSKSVGKRRILATPAAPDRICTNRKTVNFPPEAGAKHRQILQHASPEWRSTYGLLRSVIEGFNGYAKDGAHEGLDDPDKRRVRGLAAQSILCSFLVFAANIRKIRSFIKKATPLPDGTLALPRSTKRTDYVELAKTAAGPEPPGTPLAA